MSVRLSDVEYVALRLVRRFLFTDGVLARVGRLVPYYRTNQGLVSAALVVDAYETLLDQKGVSPEGGIVLEIGCGATNAVGCEISARWGAKWIGLEPYAAFLPGADARGREEAAGRRPGAEIDVRRVQDLDDVPDASIDLILSNSVLEHVFDLDGLCREMRRVLRPGGAMLHRVDYRDHFFKYPFHFLMFSEAVWQKLLGPGDLTRRRLSEHVDAFEQNGFSVDALERTCDRAAFAKAADRIHPDFRAFDPDELSTTTAALFVTGK